MFSLIGLQLNFIVQRDNYTTFGLLIFERVNSLYLILEGTDLHESLLLIQKKNHKSNLTKLDLQRQSITHLKLHDWFKSYLGKEWVFGNC